jgi:subtilase family serine protease
MNFFSLQFIPSVILLAVLSACGGGGGSIDSTGDSTNSYQEATAIPYCQGIGQSINKSQKEEIDTTNIKIKNTYLRSQLELPPPVNNSLPYSFNTPEIFNNLSNEGLKQGKINKFVANNKNPVISPQVNKTASVVYTPDQLRAAYNMTDLNSSTPSDLGAGQTIYIIDVMDHPNALVDLNNFNSRFGYPSCSLVKIPTTATSLPPASKTSCEFAVLYSTKTGQMTSIVPSYDLGWAQEIALDIQWAHAMAPLARIVLIEGAGQTLSDFTGAIKLANNLGAGIVSMSFASTEGSFVNTPAYSTNLFTTPNMTYFAASGDSGVEINWPAVVPTVVAVGGTTLNYSGTSKVETAWSSTGGGVSNYVSRPSFQKSIKLADESCGGTKYRALSDVSIVGDPSTGAYSSFTPDGGVSAWYSYGGTSLSSPMWAGIAAVINAKRIDNGFSYLSAPHSKLYNLLSNLSNYNSNFNDITTGANGTCISCSAALGYDESTGLGTPKLSNLIPFLSNSQ